MIRIRTARLELVPATAELVRAEIAGPDALGRLLGADVPDGWPPDEVRDILPAMAEALADPEMQGWQAWYWLSRAESAGRLCLVGSGGFKGRPVGGEVEIGYGTWPAHRRRGYAAEAVASLVRWALLQFGVERVVAETLPENTASLRVLEGCGFRQEGPGVQAGTVRLAVDARSRPEPADGMDSGPAGPSAATTEGASGGAGLASEKVPRVTDQAYLVSDQYRDAGKLRARVTVHRRFSTNRYGWMRWLFDQLALPAQARVLELGCGPALLWAENLHRIPEGWQVTLSDLSPGMVQQARSALEALRHGFAFRVVDAQRLPFADGSLDAVIANHMLYHVPDLDQALSEVLRVLKPGGRLYAATVGRSHMAELKDLLARYSGNDAIWQGALPDRFLLENGAGLLRRRFATVDLLRYEDALEITELEPLVAYVLSMLNLDRLLAGRPAGELVEFLRKELDANHGILRVRKDSGLFVAARPCRQARE